MNCTRCGTSELVLYQGRYYCRDCLSKVVRDPIQRSKLGLPKLEKKR
jgi:late competence protein required for DNA uptake (superfamily II DNA/RNA helicase)